MAPSSTGRINPVEELAMKQPSLISLQSFAVATVEPPTNRYQIVDI
jgi:hypothetical protein